MNLLKYHITILAKLMFCLVDLLKFCSQQNFNMAKCSQLSYVDEITELFHTKLHVL